MSERYHITFQRVETVQAYVTDLTGDAPTQQGREDPNDAAERVSLAFAECGYAALDELCEQLEGGVDEDGEEGTVGPFLPQPRPVVQFEIIQCRRVLGVTPRALRMVLLPGGRYCCGDDTAEKDAVAVE